jgi:hypothetical protein
MTGSGAHLASYQIGIGGSVPLDKATGTRADHTPPSNGVVKNGGAIPPLSVRLNIVLS